MDSIWAEYGCEASGWKTGLRGGMDGSIVEEGEIMMRTETAEICMQVFEEGDGLITLYPILPASPFA